MVRVKYMKNSSPFLLSLCYGIAFLALLSCGGKKEPYKDLPYQLSILELSSPSSSSLRGISVIDENTAWISGAKGNIVKVAGGGNKITIMRPPENEPFDYRDIHAFNERTIIAATAGFPAKVYYSENSARSWELVYEDLDSTAFLNSIHFKDSLNGLILGDRTNEYHYLLQTKDGGRSWERIDSSSLPTPLEVEHGFAASGSCIALNRNEEYLIGLGGEKSRILKGKPSTKWEAKDEQMADSSASSGIYSIATYDGRTIAVGGDYTDSEKGFPCLVSKDGGLNWIKGGVLNGYRSVVDYSSEYNIWLAAGTNGIDMSLDRGKSWNKVSDRNLNTLQFAKNSAVAYAADSEGKIYKLTLQPVK